MGEHTFLTRKNTVSNTVQASASSLHSLATNADIQRRDKAA